MTSNIIFRNRTCETIDIDFKITKEDELIIKIPKDKKLVVEVYNVLEFEKRATD